ncbi:MAG: biotin synthase BioB [Pseudomonadota bacterium]|nr:biotin synthase BioB [Pseudomonadota bacterium]
MKTSTDIRHNWTLQEVISLYELPFQELMFRAQTIHRQYHDPQEIQLSTLLSIKTGACPEDCNYCSQSGHHNTNLEKEKLMKVAKVVEQAKLAKEKGADRFCMGAAWRSPSKKDMPYVVEMVKEVKALGLETCMTLGMLSSDQAGELAEAGLDYYNHNLDTSPEHYNSIITTRTYQDRLDTLEHVRAAGMKVCAGGILGLGETRKDRASLMCALANLPAHPNSVPVNMLVPIEGTPLADVEPLEELEFVRTVAIARIMMPASTVRLSAGRENMSESTQTLCFLAGANSIFYGEALLTTPNPDADKDRQLIQKLGFKIKNAEITEEEATGIPAEVLAADEAESKQEMFIDAMA